MYSRLRTLTLAVGLVLIPIVGQSQDEISPDAVSRSEGTIAIQFSSNGERWVISIPIRSNTDNSGGPITSSQ